MSPELLKAATAYFRQHEGVIPHPYLCIHGHVTGGVGHMWPTPASMRSAGWTRGGVYVSWGEIDDAWRRLQRMPFGMQFPASSYARATDLRLSPQAIDNLLRADLEGFEAGLAQVFPEWDHYPESAQLALLDMAFSLGVRGFVTGYPKCRAAALAQDWATCAHECDRRGVSPARNAALRVLFESAIPAKKKEQ